MPRSHQRPGRNLVSIAHKKCGYGNCSGWCPPQVWYFVIKILDKKTGGNFADGPNLCYYSVFGGEHRRLYREAQLAYIISDEANPTNHPIFSLDTDLGSSLLQLTNDPEPLLKLRKKPTTSHEFSPPVTSVWNFFFDGASSREGAGAGVFFVSPA